MVPEKELRLGRLAVEQGMLTREQLSGCIEARQESGRPLSLILIERGFLDDQGVHALLECESKFRQTDLVATRPPGPHGETEDILFANLAISLGHVSLAELESCLAERGAFERRGQSMTLGQMLVKRKALPVSVFLDLSQKLEEQTLECFQCRHLESGRGRSPGQAFLCSKCGAELRIPRMEELLRHLAATAPPSPGSGAPSPVPRPPTPGGGGQLAPSEGSESRGSPASGMESTWQEPPRTRVAAEEAAGAGAPVLLGRTIAGYRIVGEIARGGMGVVYKAEQTNLSRTVALKLIRADRQSSDTRVQRFHREAQAIGRLSHPGIVQIYEVGEAEGCHFIAMEFLEGRPLDAILRDAPPAPREATRILRDLARAVAYAHSQGVLHRDLKPSNVIVDATGRPRLTDFGLAKLAGKDEMQLTHSDDVVGTPYYVPPELIQHGTRAFSERGDVYALGVIYYQLLTGRLPYRGKNSVEVYHSILHQTPVSPRRIAPAVRRTMEAVCLQAFARDAGERYAGAGELADELDRVLAGEPVTSVIVPGVRHRRTDRGRLTRRILVVVGAASLLALGWFAGHWFVGGGPGETANGDKAGDRSATPDPVPARPDPGKTPDGGEGEGAGGSDPGTEPPDTDPDEEPPPPDPDEEPPPPDPDEATRHAEFMARGQQALSEQRWEDVIQEYGQAIAIWPDRAESFDAYFNRGVACMAKGDWPTSREQFERCLRLPGVSRDNRAGATINLGAALWMLGDKDNGLRLTEDGLRDRPNDYPGRKNKANILFQCERFAESKTVLDGLLQERPDDQDVKNLLAEIAKRFGGG